MAKTKKKDNVEKQPADDHVDDGGVTQEYPLSTDKYYFRDECLKAREDGEPLLVDKMHRKGHYAKLRELAMTLMPAEWVARMQDEDLCDAMQVLFAVTHVEDEGETIVLVRRNDLQDYLRMRNQFEKRLSR